LSKLLKIAPAIAIDGAKGVGKTFTASRRSSTIWALDDPDQHAILATDPRVLTRSKPTVLLDEWQRFPRMWDVVRRQVDAGAAPGTFLLTGSATPAAGHDTHSGAGRIVSVRMRPLGLQERGVSAATVSLAALLNGTAEVGGESELGLDGYVEQIVASGFPGITSAPNRLREEYLDGYLTRVIERDLPDHGVSVRRPETLRRWLAAYAAATSTSTNYSRILDATTAGDGSQPAKTTTIAYRDHLTQLWVLDPLPGWAPSLNPFTRLQQAPKHHLADPALAVRLLGLSAARLMSPQGGAQLGQLFEALATLTVRVAAQASRARVGHLRTGDGKHEVDLIVEENDGRLVAIEVKLAATPTDADVRHLRWLKDRLGETVVDSVVLTAGSHAYRRRDGIAVVPLALLAD